MVLELSIPLFAGERRGGHQSPESNWCPSGFAILQAPCEPDWKKAREIAQQIARARVNRYAQFISEQAQRVTILRESTPAQRTVTPPHRSPPEQSWNPSMRQPTGRVPSGALSTLDKSRRGNP